MQRAKRGAQLFAVLKLKHFANVGALKHTLKPVHALCVGHSLGRRQRQQLRLIVQGVRGGVHGGWFDALFTSVQLLVYLNFFFKFFFASDFLSVVVQVFQLVQVA